MDETQVECPRCQKRLRVAATHLGMVVGCPHCHTPIRTPPVAATLADPGSSVHRLPQVAPGVATVSEPIRFKCPTCNNALAVAAILVGQKIACPQCTQRLEVPAPPRPTPTNKTVLGEFEAASPPIPPLPPAPPLPLGIRLDDDDDERPPRRERRPSRHMRDVEGGSAFANLSLVCGVGSLFLCPFFLGPLAILFGIISMAGGKEKSQQGVAIGGIVCGIIGVIISGLLVLFIVGANSPPPRRF